MELATSPALMPVRVPMIIIGDQNTATPNWYTFGISVTDGNLNKAVKYLESLSEFPYMMRAYADADRSPFQNNRQSIVNLIGSFRESLESDAKLNIWNLLSADTPNPAFELECVNAYDPEWITVAYDGVVFNLKPVLRLGPNHRDTCDTCQAGRSLLQHSLSELRNKVCYNLDSLKNGNFHFGENPILNTDGMIPVDCERDTDGNLIREFVDWFIATNEGPLTMADIELTFEIGT